jgi:hypothetical protein
VSESTRVLAKVLYTDLTENRYGVTSQQMFHNPVKMGKGNRYVSLHPIHLAGATALDPCMKTFYPFLRDEAQIDEIWKYVKQLLVEHANKHYNKFVQIEQNASAT